MMIQKTPENLLKTVKAAKTLLRNSTSGTQIAQNQRIHCLGGKKISQGRIPEWEVG